MPILVRKKVTRWGNGYGIRLTKGEAARLHVAIGDEVQGELFGPDDRVSEADLDKLAVLDVGDWGDDLDDLAADDAIADLADAGEDGPDGHP